MEQALWQQMKNQPLLKKIASEQEVFWLNDELEDAKTALSKINITMSDIEDAEARLARFAPFIQKCFPKQDINLFAHSMGSIIARVLLQENSKAYKKVVLSGYPNYQKGAYPGILFTNFITAIHGPKYKSKFILDVSKDTFNHTIKKPKTKYDWICYNEESVKSYIDDPYCGIGFTCSAYNDLFHLVVMMHKPEMYHNVNKDMELLLIRGEDDPCIGGNRGSDDSYRVLYNAGFNKIKRIDYENMRHEILAEKDNKKVYKDIINFF